MKASDAYIETFTVSNDAMAVLRRAKGLPR